MPPKSASPIEDLLRAVESPLRYLAGAAPKRLAPNALPTAQIVALIDQAEAAEPGFRDPLVRLREIFVDFPLDDEALRRSRAAAGLVQAARLRSRAPQPKPRYALTEGPIGPLLERLSSP